MDEARRAIERRRKSTGLLILDCVYKLFEAFVLWRKANEDHFAAKRELREYDERMEDEHERIREAARVHDPIAGEDGE